LSGRLLELQPVTEEELTGLADARAQALGAFFEDDPTFAGGRIRTAESGPIKKTDAGNEWVRLRLILTSN